MLGQRIRAAIDSKGLKDNWVAEGAGISKTTLSNIIRGVTPNPSVAVLVAIADVLQESVDALLGRSGHPLLKQEQETLRSAAEIITQRVLPVPNEDRVAITPLPRRKRRRPTSVPVLPVAATPHRQIFADVREARRQQIPRELREMGARRVFIVDGDSMIDAGIRPGDVLYVRTGVTRAEANGRIVVCRYGSFDCVKRLIVNRGGT
ncbi:MAG TPA: LexA family transcriptional regulator, partial [Thermoanaerobaculia bacterium]|nr:LexA family transcriptional regulator [Thermoanaerobaculia bacterium]